VSVLDTACARLALGQNTTPSTIEAAQRRLEDLAVQRRVLEREAAVGANHEERLTSIQQQRFQTEAELTSLNARWELEKTLVQRIREIREQLEQQVARKRRASAAIAAVKVDGAGVDASAVQEAATTEAQAMASADELRAELATLNEQLEALQGDSPLMRVCVDASLVGEVVSGWTGVPVGKMLRDDLAMVLQLERHLEQRVIGQNHALEYISRRVRTSRAGIEDPNKPKGVVMLVGPSGVGKTETALAISDLLYGGEQNLITINMSELQEAHTVSTLKGSPPGYVGYGEGGVLTEAVRRRPYSVVLLDEVEKAHPDVLELFYQVFDKGMMEDGEGREIDFKNTIIILTTNASTDTMTKLCADPETAPDPENMVKALKPELNKIFKPAFLGRMLVVPYNPIRDEALHKIIVLKLNRIKDRLFQNHRISLDYDTELVTEVARRCTEVESGARNVDHILTNTLLPEISRQLLGRMAEGEKLDHISVKIAPDGTFVYQGIEDPHKGVGYAAD